MDARSSAPTMAAPAVAAPRDHGIPFGEALRVWARVAALSFGGPAGQIAVMHRILVEEKRWVGEARFLHALNYCMLLPGPEAQQLATYLGWLLHRTKGGLVAGTLFVLPGFVAILALSLLYATYGQVELVAGLFFGLKAAVLAIVLQAIARLGSRALANGTMVALAAVAFVAIAAFDVPFPLIVLGAALVGYAAGRAGSGRFAAGRGHGGTGAAVLHDRDSELGEQLPAHARPDARWSLRISSVLLLLWLAPVAVLWLALGPEHVYTRVGTFFSQMAVVTFGGAYAVLAYVAQAAVETYGWLRPAEMLDGLAMAETTPGPLIQVVQFVGFMGAFRDPGALHPLLAGTFAAVLTTWVTFLPCFLWIFLGAPFVERLRGHAALSSALAAISAAVVGVIANLAFWFAVHTLFREARETGLGPATLDVPVLATVDPVALLLTVAAIVATFVLRAGMFTVLAGCAAAGIAYHVLA